MSIRMRFAVMAIVLMLQGCQSIGVGSVQRDRLDYGGAIADSWKEQTLLNIIKLRYFDTPTFLDVSTVISSYQLQSEVSFGREIFPNAPGDTNRSFGLTGIYTDRPTISYAPLTGEKFVNSLAMILSGHQADFILRATVRAINDVYNHSASPARARREDPAFAQVIAALRRIQQAGALGMRIEARPVAVQGGRGDRPVTADTAWIFFREGADAETAADIAFVRKSLDIDPAIRELRLGFGSLRTGGGEIALLTRSIMEILVELSSGVEVPEQHLAEGRARPLQKGEGSPGGGNSYPVARVLAGEGPPADAYVAVRYRNHWFWIDDRDLASKRAFSFLKIFSSIAETGVVPQQPVLTIPAN